MQSRTVREALFSAASVYNGLPQGDINKALRIALRYASDHGESDMTYEQSMKHFDGIFDATTAKKEIRALGINPTGLFQLSLVANSPEFFAAPLHSLDPNELQKFHQNMNSATGKQHEGKSTKELTDHRAFTLSGTNAMFNGIYALTIGLCAALGIQRASQLITMDDAVLRDNLKQHQLYIVAAVITDLTKINDIDMSEPTNDIATILTRMGRGFSHVARKDGALLAHDRVAFGITPHDPEQGCGGISAAIKIAQGMESLLKSADGKTMATDLLTLPRVQNPFVISRRDQRTWPM